MGLHTMDQKFYEIFTGNNYDHITIKVLRNYTIQNRWIETINRPEKSRITYDY